MTKTLTRQKKMKIKAEVKSRKAAVKLKQFAVGIDKAEAEIDTAQIKKDIRFFIYFDRATKESAEVLATRLRNNKFVLKVEILL